MQKVAIDTPANARLAEQRDVEHRPLLPPLDHDEQHEQGCTADQRAEDQPTSPAVRVPAEDPEDDQEQCRGEADEPRDISAAGVDVTRLRHPRDREEQREDPDRHVHVEDPPPPGRVGEDASDQRPRGDGRADGGPPDRECAEPLGPTVLVADQGEGRCEERGAPHALKCPGEIEHGDAPGRSAQRRRPGEHDHTDKEDQASPVAVGERAAGEDQDGQGQRIRIERPLQTAEIGAEPALDARQRDHDDRDVEQQHERRRTDRNERPSPPPAVVDGQAGPPSSISGQDGDSTETTPAPA